LKYEERRWTHDEPDWKKKTRRQPVAGPWDAEPDKIQWVDPATDLDCLMVRNGMGYWCGYVGVDKSHLFHGVDYDSCPYGNTCSVRAASTDWWADCDHTPNSKVSVHGGLTFARDCNENAPEGHGVCHVPYEGREPDVWWLGFDTAHCGDASPMDAADGAYPLTMPEYKSDDTYKDEAYVRNEVENLAKQLKAVADDVRVG